MLPSRLFLSGLTVLAGCGGLTEGGQLPAGVQDPAQARTPQGALAAYHGVRDGFRAAVDTVVVAGALLTDEFARPQVGSSNVFGRRVGLDDRYLPSDYSPGDSPEAHSYVLLHRVRGEAREALGLLATYAPDAPPALRGHLYALLGYAEVLLADLFCSGIPLSTIDFGGDYTLRPGSRTEQVYQHALTLFDTAVTLAADSARILHLTQVGRGRALLALGRYDSAGQAAAGVPGGFRYAVQYTTGRPNFMVGYTLVDSDRFATGPGKMTDREGGNGLPYLTSGDPRVAADSLRGPSDNVPIYLPAKYDRNGTGTIVVADWMEARPIEAEAALHAGDVGTWLARLNQLRQIAIEPALPDTTDPGTLEGRVNLTFHERAFWLFLTGHRQGDLRRLVREYGRHPESVYPSGPYPGGGVYGTDVTIAVPPEERELNPQYTGCFHRRA